MASDDFRDNGERLQPLTRREFNFQAAKRQHDLQEKKTKEFEAQIKETSGPEIAERFRKVHLIDDGPVLDRAVDNVVEDLAQRRVALAQVSPDDVTRRMSSAADKAEKFESEASTPQTKEADGSQTETKLAERDSSDAAPLFSVSRGLERPTNHYASLAPEGDRLASQVAESDLQRSDVLDGPDTAERAAHIATPSQEISSGESRSAKAEENEQAAGEEMTDARQAQSNAKTENPIREAGSATPRPPAGPSRGGR
jgi:hypothetical protein